MRSPTRTVTEEQWVDNMSPFLSEQDVVLRCSMCSITGSAPPRQACATLGAVSSLSLGLGPLGWVSFLSQVFPGQIQTILPMGSLPGCRARGWHCLSYILKGQGAAHHPSVRHQSPLSPLAAPQRGWLGILGLSGAL